MLFMIFRNRPKVTKNAGQRRERERRTQQEQDIIKNSKVMNKDLPLEQYMRGGIIRIDTIL